MASVGRASPEHEGEPPSCSVGWATAIMHDRRRPRPQRRHTAGGEPPEIADRPSRQTSWRRGTGMTGEQIRAPGAAGRRCTVGPALHAGGARPERGSSSARSLDDCPPTIAGNRQVSLAVTGTVTTSDRWRGRRSCAGVAVGTTSSSWRDLPAEGGGKPDLSFEVAGLGAVQTQ